MSTEIYDIGPPVFRIDDLGGEQIFVCSLPKGGYCNFEYANLCK